MDAEWMQNEHRVKQNERRMDQNERRMDATHPELTKVVTSPSLGLAQPDQRRDDKSETCGAPKTSIPNPF